MAALRASRLVCSAMPWISPSRCQCAPTRWRAPPQVEACSAWLASLVICCWVWSSCSTVLWQLLRASGHLAVGVLDVAGNLVGGAGHLGHGGRHLLGLGILLVDVEEGAV